MVTVMAIIDSLSGRDLAYPFPSLRKFKVTVSEGDRKYLNLYSNFSEFLYIRLKPKHRFFLILELLYYSNIVFQSVVSFLIKREPHLLCFRNSFNFEKFEY